MRTVVKSLLLCCDLNQNNSLITNKIKSKKKKLIKQAHINTHTHIHTYTQAQKRNHSIEYRDKLFNMQIKPKRCITFKKSIYHVVVRVSVCETLGCCL